MVRQSFTLLVKFEPLHQPTIAANSTLIGRAFLFSIEQSEE